jgi:hypothetical protein
MRSRSKILRALGAFILFSMLTALVPAEAASILGRNTVGSVPSGALRADYKRGSKFQLAEAGTLLSLCVYLDGNGGGAGSGTRQEFHIAVYRDVNGVPGEKVTETEPDTTLDQGSGGFWHCVGADQVPLLPGAYWLVLHTGENAYGRYYADGTSGNWYGNADSFADDASDPFGAGSAGDGTLSIYAVYEPHTVFGRTTVGSTPSGALRADYKRGSSFTLPEQARITSLSGYFDGLGAASGSQFFSLNLYSDKNGVPDQFITGTANVAQFQAGRAAKWITLGTVSKPVIQPGKYWITVHTGGPPVGRYYADGTGNWYGNAETYAPFPSNPFGPGSAGDGTLSVFASYERGPFTAKTLGRTTVASTPLQPLSKNYIRGSKFTLSDPLSSISGLHAYIDGLGGASGSQKMKMAVFTSGQDLVALSDEVIVTAGMAPQWVYFPVGAQSLPTGSYYIMLFTGSTQGIARVYGDGPNNWYGAPASYDTSGGLPPNEFFEVQLQAGERTLSVYADYVTSYN